MAIKTRAQIQTELDVILLDTASQGSITPSVIKGILQDIIDSSVISHTDTNLQGLYPFDLTIAYYAGAIVQYDYKWYKANTTTTAGTAFNPAQWDLQGYISYAGSLTIATADVLTLNSVPKTLITAIASRTLRVRNIRASIAYNSVAYATNTTLNIYMAVSGTSNSQFTIPSLLVASADQHRIGTVTAGAQLASATDVKVSVNTGDPTAGNSPITIYYEYEVI